MLLEPQASGTVLNLQNGQSVTLSGVQPGAFSEANFILASGNGSPPGDPGAPVEPPSLPLIGTAADDTLTGTDGADIIEGHGGNDLLIGAGGADTYLWSFGDGFDTVRATGDTTGQDIIKVSSAGNGQQGPVQRSELDLGRERPDRWGRYWRDLQL